MKNIYLFLLLSIAGYAAVAQTDISGKLYITRDTAGHSYTYSVLSSPIHGIMGGFPHSFTATTTGDTLMPSGFTYTPTDTMYHGPDTFAIRITDPAESLIVATVTVYVTIDTLLTPPPAPYTPPFKFGGQVYYEFDVPNIHWLPPPPASPVYFNIWITKSTSALTTTGGSNPSGSVVVSLCGNCSYNEGVTTVNICGVQTTDQSNYILPASYNVTNTSSGDPHDVAVDVFGNILIADNGNHRIRMKNAVGIVSTIAGNGTAGYGGDNGPATAAEINDPYAITADMQGNLYIADFLDHRVRKINYKTGIMTTIAGNGSDGYSGDGSPATMAQIGYPTGIAVDLSGNIYIADSAHHVVRKVNTSGTISTFAGDGTPGFSGDGSSAVSAMLNEPHGLSVDTPGNSLLIADAANNRIRSVKFSTGNISTIAGTGSTGYSGDTTMATAATLNYPMAVAADNYGFKYIADYGNNVIRVMQPDDTIYTYAGTGVAGSAGDGLPAYEMQLNHPTGVAVDHNGRVTIADMGNNSVRFVGTPPIFTGGFSQTLTLCANDPVTSLDTVAAVSDLHTGLTETWTAFSNPAHGTLGGFTSATAASNGGIVLPSGLTYTPNPGFFGRDTFYIQVSNGADKPVTEIDVTVYPPPATITGTKLMCGTGITTNLSDVIYGGVWSSSNTTIATIGTTGIVTGLAYGMDTVIYTATFGCSVTAVVSVNPVPAAIVGPDSVCAGAMQNLTDVTTGGTWSSSSIGVASVATGGGDVTGVTAGTAVISYTSAGGCTATEMITVNPLPSGITGSTAVCLGAMTTLADATTGGEWSVTNTTVAIIGSGIVTGLAAGMDTVIYTLATGCKAIISATVNAGPAAITGSAVAYSGGATDLTDATPDGTWSSSNASIASADATTGVIAGAALGTAIVTYTTACGIATTTVTVNTPPAGSPNNFNYTGSMQTYTVPVGVTLINVDMEGAAGGGGSYSQHIMYYCCTTDDTYFTNAGGSGACVHATLAVTPGQVLDIYVGGQGTPTYEYFYENDITDSGYASGYTGTGGYNGGGNGSPSDLISGGGGGGGGGASDIRIGGTELANRVVVAGGGGGAGLLGVGSTGGAGGGLTGADGLSGGYDYGDGSGATQTEGGFSGGAPGTGGDGTGIGTDLYGGGGGGGYYGGGGSGWYAGGGGGGGSSYTDPTIASGVVHTRGCNAGNGIVTITPVLCDGTITAGTATASPSVGGHGNTFTLNLPEVTFASGITYQWQSSADGVLFTDISGATNITYTFTGITANTYYRCIATCTFTGTTSTSSSAEITYALTPVCTPTSADWDEESLGTSILGIDAYNITGYGGSSLSDAGIVSAADATTGYLSRTTSVTPVNLEQGGVYASSVTWGYANSYQDLQVWVDFNDDGTFQVSEEVTPVTGRNATATANPTNFYITIPASAAAGPHLMRIRGFEEAATISGPAPAPAHLDPCLFEYGGVIPSYLSGDVADYIVNIVAMPPCSGAPVAGNDTTSAFLACPASTIALGLTGTGLATGLTYQWQSSLNSTTWTDIGGANATSYVTTESAGSYYRCNVTCTLSTQSTPSGSVFVPYVSNCFCTPYFSNASYSCANGYNVHPFLLSGEAGTAISDYSSCNGTTDYEDNSRTMSVALNDNTTYTAQIASSASLGLGGAQVWIDFDDDGIFETTESVGGISLYSSTTLSSFSISIPAIATPGQHRMRLVAPYPFDEVYPDIDPCATGAGAFGDARDYTVIINNEPSFINGATQTITVCQTGLADSVNSLASFFDGVGGNTDGLTISSGPSHGTLGGFPASITSTGETMTPTGLTYTPATGYSGADAFTLHLSSGAHTATTTINITVDTPISAAPITGSAPIVCDGAFLSLTDAAPGGSWSESGAWAINYGSGEFYFVLDGVDTIVYTVSNYCGTITDTAVFTVDPYPTITDISGPDSVYTDATIALTDATTGGTWFSSDYTIAYVSDSGVVSGVAPGIATIYYEVSTDCATVYATATITVSDAPPGGVSPLIHTFAGNGTAGYIGDGASVFASQLSNPTGVAVDDTGNIYIADRNNNVVRKVNISTGIISTFAGINSAGPGYNGDGIPATSAQLNNPTGVAVDAYGNVYIADEGNQAVRIVDVTGNINTFAGSPGSPGYTGDYGPAVFAYLNNPSCVAVDGSGNVYIADRGNNVVRNVDVFGNIYTYAGDGTGTPGYFGDGGPAYAALLNNPSSVAADGSGNVYIADENNSIVRIVNGLGNINTFAGTGGISGNTGDGAPAIAAQLGSPTGLSLDRSGNVFIADSQSNVVRRVDVSGNISTYAGDATAGYSGDGNAANDISVMINNPAGLAFDTSGNLYIADQANNVIRLVGTLPVYYSAPAFANGSPQPFAVCENSTAAPVNSLLAVIDSNAGLTDTLTILSGPSNGTLGGFPTTVSATTGSGATPTGLTYTPAAGYTGIDSFTIQVSNSKTAITTVYVSVDTVQTSIPPITGPTSAYPGVYITLYDAATGGTWSSSDYATAYVDAYGDVYGYIPGTATISYAVTNGCGAISATQAVTFAYPTGGTSPDIYTFAGNNTQGYSGDGSAATSAELYLPFDVATDGAGNVYIADLQNFVIRKVNTSGIISTIAGNGTFGSGGDGGPATSASLSYVYGIAADATGNVYVADNFNNVVRKIDLSGNINTYAGNSMAGYAGDGGPATSAQLNSPRSLTIDSAGNLYIGDWGNHVVRKVDASGNISTFAGNNTAVLTGDGGPATAAAISEPFGLAADHSGNLYIADFEGSVRKVDMFGIISTFAGGGSSGYTGDGGPATAAQFNGISCVAVDSSGNVYIADYFNDVIRKVDGSGIISTYAGYGGVGYSGDGGPANDARLNSPYGIAVTGSGKLYIADAYNNVIRIVGVPAYTHSLAFNGGATQTFTVCEDTGADSINTLLALNDSTTGLIDTFSISSGPLHGTLGGFYATDTSNGGLIMPTGLTYTPADGYSGTDTFTINVSDGSAIATETIFVTVNPLPVAGTISGTTTVCAGSMITLTDGATGGVWSSDNMPVATVSGGVVYGLTTGSANIDYTVTNGCGTAVASAAVTVNPLPDAGSISGATTVCAGSMITLTDGATGGVWSSDNTLVASISEGDVISGVAAGSANVDYTVTNGCGTAVASVAMTVNPLPDAGSISGTTTVCAGSMLTLTDGATGGVWSSDNMPVATVSGGVVYGLTTGSANIDYTVTNGCGMAVASVAMTVNPLPDAGSISGPATVCVGAASSITLTNATSGGTWTCTNSKATINASGMLTGVANGTDTVRYTVANMCGSSAVTKVITVSTLSVAGIGGTSSVCAGSTITLTDGTTGGTWSSSNTLATVSGGMVTGLSAGTDVITYSVNGACGSSNVIKTITINAIPSAGPIAGTAFSICVGGATITLSDTSTTGTRTWSSSNTAIATVANTTSGTLIVGVVHSVSAGIAAITYTHTVNTCVNTATATITVNPQPSVAGITGATAVCAGSMDTLSDAVTGGTWSSGTHASVGSTTGIVTGGTAGSSLITYKITDMNGCTNTTAVTVTVNALPTVAVMGGPATVCAGSPATFTETTTGGIWSYSKPGYSITLGGTTTVTATVTDTVAGADTMTYTVTNAAGCITTVYKSTTVNALPAVSAITGPGSVCAGSPVTLSDATTGTHTWSSGNTSIATVTSGGIVHGVSPGSVTITYAYTSGCTNSVTATVIVDSLPVVPPIAGNTPVCINSSITLTDAYTGGSWTSSSPTRAAIGSASGIVTGLNGTAPDPVITYSVTDMNGCSSAATTAVTVNILPSVAVMGGPATVCAGSPATFTETTTGGIWSYSKPGYSVTLGGTTTVTATVTDTVAGADTMKYTVTNGVTGCSFTVYKSVTVNVLPAVFAITGPGSVCAGSPVTLSDATTGTHTWSSGNTSIATVTSGGIVHGVSPGSVTITYAYTSGCTNSVTATVIVDSLPVVPPIAGNTPVCINSSITLTDAYTGGSWISSSPTRAAIGSASGIVTGLNGTAPDPVITYSVTDMNGCSSAATTAVTVNILPSVAVMGGPATVCAGSPATFTETTTGGIWSYSKPGYSITLGGTTTVTATVTDTVAGADTMTYTVTNAAGCMTTVYKSTTVNALPAVSAITGPGSVCAGSPVTLSDATTGTHTWSSGNTSIATVTSGGIVHGVSPGSATITYAYTSGCTNSVTATVIVDSLPVVPPIAGNTPVCINSSITLTDAYTGGSWISSSPTRAAIGSASGIVTGLNGTAPDPVITYSVTDMNGCSSAATTAVTVNILPSVAVMGGPATVCAGSPATFTETTTGGIWSYSKPGYSITLGGTTTVTATVTDTVAGFDTMTYTVTNTAGCITTVYKSTTVNALPAVASITGPGSVCAGSPVTLSDATTGTHTWSSGNTSIATVTSGGIVHGVSPGSATITYAYTSGCTNSVTATVIVDTLPVVSSITGNTPVCIGSMITLTDAYTGGTWSSNSTARAIVSPMGVVTGESASTPAPVISYSVTDMNGCSSTTTATVTVNALPTVAAIGGPSTVCTGATILLSDATTGGAWGSGNTALATISGGIVDGLSPGRDTIAYSVTNALGCTGTAQKTVTVNTVPVAGMISGSATLFTASTDTLSETVSGGTWTNTNHPIATISAGIVYGVSAGTSTISYTVSNSCGTAITTFAVSVTTHVAGRQAASTDSTASAGDVINPGETIMVYPNPTAGSFTVDVSELNGDLTVTISDVQGRVVETRSVSDKDNRKVQYNLSNVARGTYLIKVYSGDTTYSEKIVIW